jgi:hypothetical protein
MAKAWRPGFWHKTRDTEMAYRFRDAKRDNIWVEFPTYRELKSNIKQYLEESSEPTISVYRHRRGEWGEWYERWELINGKPKIVQSGWN